MYWPLEHCATNGVNYKSIILKNRTYCASVQAPRWQFILHTQSKVSTHKKRQNGKCYNKCMVHKRPFTSQLEALRTSHIVWISPLKSLLTAEVTFNHNVRAGKKVNVSHFHVNSARWPFLGKHYRRGRNLDSKILKHFDIFLTLYANDLLAADRRKGQGIWHKLNQEGETAQHESPPLPRQTNRYLHCQRCSLEAVCVRLGDHLLTWQVEPYLSSSGSGG